MDTTKDAFCKECDKVTTFRYLHEKPDKDCESCRPAKPCSLMVCRECGSDYQDITIMKLGIFCSREEAENVIDLLGKTLNTEYDFWIDEIK